MLRKPFTEIDQKILTVEQSLVASHFLRERPGPGDGERKTLLIRQIAFEPLPASVFGSPSLVDVMSAASSGGRGAVAECVVVSGLGGILSNVCNGYRIANRPGKEDEEIAVSQQNSVH